MLAVPAGATTTAPPSESTAPAECAPGSPVEAPAPDAPEATVAAAEVSQTDIADPETGIRFSGEGFTPDSKATVTVIGTDGREYTPKVELTVNEDGEVNGVYFFTTSDGAKVPTGEYQLFLTDVTTKKESSKVSFSVVEQTDETQAPLPADTECTTPAPAPSTSAPEETASEDATPSETPTETPTPAETETEEAAAPEETEEPTAEPTESATEETQEPAEETTEPAEETTEPAEGAEQPQDNDDTQPVPAAEEPETETSAPDQTPAPTESDTGTPAPTATDTETETPEASDPASSDPESTATESTPGAGASDDVVTAMAATIRISPTEISSAEFADSEEGVIISGSGFAEGERVTVTVEHAQGKVKRFTTEKNADDEGNVDFGVHAATDPVLGEYRVTVESESADPQGGSFTVVTNGTSVGDEAAGGGSAGQNGNSGNSGSGGNGSGGSDSSESATALPRTGSEMTGLALGAGLLVVGAAAVVITRRRAAASDDAANV
ncbi:LPXTG cell wall anchor domain-containing protein [Brevibacterium daeguense]|uniref:LPXTG cell wall anchor domain-containing protein n=1 Tax=Brevibacterium daeguense TaxID=909936 RepID=UPI001F0001C3|nr:LPXTG cell wall anchor domain-containing protein [Brevibacterium daeguense]